MNRKTRDPEPSIKSEPEPERPEPELHPEHPAYEAPAGIVVGVPGDHTPARTAPIEEHVPRSDASVILPPNGPVTDNGSQEPTNPIERRVLDEDDPMFQAGYRAGLAKANPQNG